MYIFVHFSGPPLCKYVKYLRRPPTCCKYVLYLPHRNAILPCTVTGDPMVPHFKNPMSGFFYLHNDLVQEQDRFVHIFRTHGPPCKYFIFTHDHLWLVFILVILSLNLVVSCPYVSYYLYLHIFMLFRSTCLWLFSVDNPPRVATEALNIHLVSCILYHN